MGLYKELRKELKEKHKTDSKKITPLLVNYVTRSKATN